ncbi:MAG: class I lanthipeptide [Candidatus Aminicenantes bacterium]|jgi:natural product precursor
MKSKTFNKKLVLNKKTNANLKNEEMTPLKGGRETIPHTLCIQNPASYCHPCLPCL